MTGIKRDYDVAVFIGRMRPFHNGHMAVLQKAFETAEHVVVIVGSAEKWRDEYNLFDENEVIEMVERSLSDEQLERISFVPVRDVGNVTQWSAAVRKGVYDAAPMEDPRVALVGHNKDGTSYYLKLFVGWDSVDVENYDDINATLIRELLVYNSNPLPIIEKVKDLLPDGTVDFLLEWIQKPYLDKVREEARFMALYLDAFECEGNRKFEIKPKFYTCDNVVFYSGHVLMVQRKAFPAKDAWALPGGHVNDDEGAEQASLRELAEETNIDVSKAILRRSQIASKVFDDPHRSTRGRTITNAFVYALEPIIRGTDPARIQKDLDFPKIRAADDAKKAEWIPVEKVLGEMRSSLMEDHALIIEWALKQLEGDK